MPTSITFLYHDEDFQKPTMTVFADGTWKEHGLPFLRRRACVVRLERCDNQGPSRKQLDAVKLISSYAIEKNPYCILIYKCFTSPGPWTPGRRTNSSRSWQGPAYQGNDASRPRLSSARRRWCATPAATCRWPKPTLAQLVRRVGKANRTLRASAPGRKVPASGHDPPRKATGTPARDATPPNPAFWQRTIG